MDAFNQYIAQTYNVKPDPRPTTTTPDDKPTDPYNDYIQRAYAGAATDSATASTDGTDAA